MVYTAQGSVRKKGTKYKAQSVLILCGNVLQSLCEFWISDCKLMLLWFLWASGHMFINWWIRHLVFCVFLFKDTFLIYIVASFTWNSRPTAPSLVAEGRSSNTRIFSTSHVTASLRLGTLDSITHYAWKAFWTIKPSTKITQKHEICGTNRLHKGHRFLVCAEVRRQTVTLLDLIEYALGNSNFPPLYE